MCRETVPEIGGGDWKDPLADNSEVVRWNNQLVGCRQLVSQARWHVSDSGEVGLQVHESTAIYCSVGEYSDYEENVLWNTKTIRSFFSTNLFLFNILILCFCINSNGSSEKIRMTFTARWEILTFGRSTWYWTVSGVSIWMEFSNPTLFHMCTRNNTVFSLLILPP